MCTLIISPGEILKILGKTSLCNNTNHIFIRNGMTQSHPLRYMSCTRSPHQSVLECFLERSVDLIAHVFNCRVGADYECFWKVWFDSFSVLICQSLLLIDNICSISSFFDMVSRYEVAEELPFGYLLVYTLIKRNSFQHVSTTSCMPRSSSQLITTVWGSRASWSRNSILTLSILL